MTTTGGMKHARISCSDAFRHDLERILCLDIETTGLDRRSDDILSLAIVDGTGGVRYHGYFRPQLKSEWPEAQAINHIDLGEVKDSPRIRDEAERISEILWSSEVLMGYNLISFDLPFLEEKGIAVPPRPACDVMLEYTEKHGERDEDRQRYKWISLAKCASDLGVTFRPHDPLEDSMATMKCASNLANNGIS